MALTFSAYWTTTSEIHNFEIKLATLHGTGHFDSDFHHTVVINSHCLVVLLLSND